MFFRVAAASQKGALRTELSCGGDKAGRGWAPRTLGTRPSACSSRPQQAWPRAPAHLACQLLPIDWRCLALWMAKPHSLGQVLEGTTVTKAGTGALGDGDVGEE